MRTFICKTCGKESYNKYNRIRTYCSKSCRNRDPDLIEKSNEVRKKTWESKYGGHPMLLIGVQEKFKETLQERYGVDHALQSKEIFQKSCDSKEERYGDPHYSNSEKGQKTRLERYNAISLNKEYCAYRRLIKSKWTHIEILDDILTCSLKEPVAVKCTSCQREWKVILNNNYVPICM